MTSVDSPNSVDLATIPLMRLVDPCCLLTEGSVFLNLTRLFSQVKLLQLRSKHSSRRRRRLPNPPLGLQLQSFLRLFTLQIIRLVWDSMHPPFHILYSVLKATCCFGKVLLQQDYQRGGLFGYTDSSHLCCHFIPLDRAYTNRHANLARNLDMHEYHNTILLRVCDRSLSNDDTLCS